MKTLHMIFSFFTNVVFDSPVENARKLTKETRVLEALTYVFENVGQLHSDVLENIMIIVSEISKLKSLTAVDI